MRTSEYFASKFLKAEDLKGKRHKVTIDRVEMEDVGDEEKPVVHFKGWEKGLVMNKTNATVIGDIAKTDEWEDWAGIQVVLYSTRVTFQGKLVAAIRVDFPADAVPEAASAAEEDNITY